MTATDDDVIASWQERVGTLRKRGRVSAATLAVVPASNDLDVRRGRPSAPARLSEQERELWERLIFSRRPGWFIGAEELLESYITMITQVQRLEAALRKAKPGTGERYEKLMRMIGNRWRWRPRWRRGYGSRRIQNCTRASRRTVSYQWPDKRKGPGGARRRSWRPPSGDDGGEPVYSVARVNERSFS